MTEGDVEMKKKSNGDNIKERGNDRGGDGDDIRERGNDGKKFEDDRGKKFI